MSRFSVKNWWSRPCGGWDVFALALPLVISTASWTLMNFIDRMFLLWYSPAAMAAAMPAGMLHFTMICFPLGVASYVNTFVAQYHGAQRPERIGTALWQGMRIGLVTTPLALATIPLAPHIFRLAGHSPGVGPLEVIYFQVLAFGAGAVVMSASLSAFFTGRGKTGVVMCVDSAAALLNIVLDYALIFGHFGLPQMGIEGAAWATACSQWTKVVAYWLLINTAANRRTFGLREGARFDADLWRRLLRYGGPSGLQLLVEVGEFTLFILLVGRLGEDAQVATTLAFNVNSVAFVPLLGVGIAVTTLVGQQLGAGRPDLAARGTWTAFTMSLVYTGSLGVLYLAVPDWFLFGHAWGAGAEKFAPLRDMVVVLLRFVAAYCLFDAMNIIFASAIKGAGDTRFILRTAALTSPAPVLIGWAGIRFWEFGLIWCWGVITGWICVLGMIYLARFLQGHWREMRVIEPELLGEDPQEVVEPVAI